MKLTKKLEKEIFEVYDRWMHSYLNADVETYDSFFDNDYHFIGSTNNEEFLNRKETTNFFKETADQLSGKTELRNGKKVLEKFGELVILTHLFDAWFLNKNKWSYYGRFRFTSFLMEKKEGWRFIYQHFSTTDSKAEKGETIGYDQVSAENQKLRDAIKRRTSELETKNRQIEIEAALDKVRSRSMAMHQSDELKAVIKVIFDQMTLLNINAEHAGIVVDYEPKKDFHFWVADAQDIPAKITVPYLDLVWDRQFTDAKKSGKDFFTTQLDFKEKNSFYKELLPHIKGLTKKARDFYLNCPGLAASTVIQKDIGLYIENFSGIPYTDEENSILTRIGKVFQQTYTRFLDLQKAEAQAREAQIEAALERVRSRSMAMHETHELHDVLSVLFQQFDKLDIKPVTAFLSLFDLENNQFTYRSTTKAGNRSQTEQILDFAAMEQWEEVLRQWKSESINDIHEIHYKKDALPQLFELFDETFSAAPEGERATIDDFPNGGYSLHAYCKFGYLGLNLAQEASEEEKEILIRFAREFTRLYQRFLDLQKAEKQAREAQIEVALERVRSRTMAMQKSEELGETAELLFQQVKELGIESWCTGFNIWQKDNNSFIDRISLEFGFIEPYEVDCDAHPFFSDVATAKKNGEDFHVFELEGEYLEEIYKIMEGMTGLSFEKIKESGMTLPSRQINHYVFGQEVSLLFITFEPCPEAWNIFKRFGKVFQQTYTRFLDLEKAEAQTKEVQIEAALERVRSKTMAMHSSSDVKDTVKTFFDEVLKLGIDNSIRCGIGILEGYEGMETWSANATDEGDVEMRYGMLNMNIHPMLRGLKKAWKNGEKGYSYNYTQKDVLKYYKALNNEPEYPFNADLDHLPKKEYHNSFFFSSGIIFAFTENPLTEESSAVLHRFAEVFGQTYRRFLDLQKVEAQSREAQIELALERVRNRAMTMMKSDELGDLIITVFKELQGLDMELTRCLLWIFNKEDESAVTWMTNSEDPDSADHYKVPFHNHPAYISYIKGWKAELPEWEYHLKGKNKDDWDEILVEGFFKKLPRKVKNAMKAPERVILSGSFNKYGLIQTAGLQPLSNENKGIVKRFSKVFEQNYNRFLDLKKAEKQAREAQIEAALEKVRSRTMAMQSSDELQEAANLLFLEVQGLGINAWSAGYNIVNKDKTQSVCWMSSEGELQDPFPLYFSKEASFKAMGKFLKSDETFYVQELKGKALVKHYDYMKSLPELKDTFQHLVDAGLSLPTYQINHLCKFSRGFLLFITYEQVPEAHIIFQRFTKIFEQTYTRFQDLQKAENQAKETIKNASVDRIRAEIASMRTSTDLQRITPLVWTELTTLNVPFIRCGVFIMDEEKQQVQTHLSTPDGKAIASFDLPFENTKPLDQLLPYWRKKEMYTDFWDEKAFIESTKILMQRGAITSSENYITENQPTSLHLHFFPFLQGMLYVGSEVTLTNDELNLAQNLAEAFSSAYARYEDFNKLELANKKIEKTLTDLKQTQTQLIQSEKMASLGELTAGIAHEIQNPLNFVNNFSEVSHELLIEMKEELDNGDLEEVREITNDIEQNLEKINHHGQRASDIVKGMLQHSRSSSGAKELTDINALADEYLRLAYHGLRAKDKTFNAKLVTEFDESLDKINIVPQDIGRVILNLITNAFHTVSEKKKATSEPYDPTVTVSTKKLKDSIEIKVADNGNGIPKKVLDKIFQPFFTTKPTGQGTGLGLSLSYDIVKAHGGELKVKTKENKGTEFSILLPI